MNITDFTRCQRADGTYYGTAGQCRKGREVDPSMGTKKGYDLAAKLKEGKLTSANLIGDGAYGKVYDIGDGVLVKVGEIPESEKTILDKLKSVPNVPRVLAYGRSKVKEDHAIMAMTKVPGVPIEKLSESEQKRAFDMVYPLLRKIHEKGISHNDLHGGNILYDRKTNSVSLIDFGLADEGPAFAQINDLMDMAMSSTGAMGERVMESLERRGLFGDQDPTELPNSLIKKKLKQVWQDIS